MVRAVTIWWSFFSNTLTRDMEFKANFLGSLFVDAIFYGSHFFFFHVIFSFVNDLGEFSAQDVQIFLIITFLSDTFYMLFFSGNLFNLNRMIVRGDLDFVLLKPINAQFMASFRYVKSYTLISLVILVLLLIQLILSSEHHIQLLNVLVFIYSFFLGLSIWYSFDFIIGCISFWAKNFTVGGWLSSEVMKFSLRPDSIYTGFLRRTLFTVIPMALIMSIPTRMLLYEISVKYLFIQTIIAISFLALTRIVWRSGLRLYESASS